MKLLYIASDHAGFKLKEFLLRRIQSSYNLDIKDLGCNSSDESCDYTDFAFSLSDNIANNKDSIGILICGTGIGMSIAANRFKNIRAALCHNEEYAALSREHNDANILVLGARYLSEEEAYNIVKVFLNTEFSKEDRHIKRCKKLMNHGE